MLGGNSLVIVKMRNSQGLANFNNGSREKKRKLPVWAPPNNSSPKF